MAYDISGIVPRLPYCAVCCVPVRSLYVDFLDSPDGSPNLILFVAHCHEAYDVVDFEIRDWVTFDSVEIGWAFGNPPPTEGHHRPADDEGDWTL